jgi:hypothetical protein
MTHHPNNRREKTSLMARIQPLLLASALFLALGALSGDVSGNAVQDDPHGCSCGINLALISGGPSATGVPPNFGCAEELVFYNVTYSDALCTLECAPLFPPAKCQITVGLVYWDTQGSSSPIDEDLNLSSGCGSTIRITYPCPSDPLGVQVGMLMSCKPDCEAF